MMRPDELYGINILTEYLYERNGSYPCKILNEPFGKSTAPDFIIKFGQKSIAVEVTQTGHGFLLDSEIALTGDPKQDGIDRIEYESSAENLLEKSYQKDVSENGDWIKHGETIVITYLTPLPTYKRTKVGKKILTSLKSMYRNNQILKFMDINTDYKPTITVPTGQDKIKGVTLNAFLTSCYSSRSNYSPIIENFGCSLNSPDSPYDGSLNMQCCYTLSTIIEKKERKTSSINLPKWLLLLNTHPLLEPQDYKDFLNDNSHSIVNHQFNKIFVIHNGECFEIFNTIEP